MGLYFIAFIALPHVTVAQNADETATSFHDRVSDLVALKDGTKLWGSAGSEKPATLLIRTEWLRNESPEFYAAEVRPELQNEKQPTANGLADLLQKDVERLESLEEKDQQRIGLLKEIIGRLTAEDAGPGQWRYRPIS